MSFYDSIKIIVNIAIIIIIGVIIWWFFKERKVNVLDKRLGKFSIESKNNVEYSLFDNIYNVYTKTQNNLNKVLSKSSILVNYSKKYEKYIDKRKNKNSKPMNFITAKFICSLIILLLVIFSDVLQRQNINFGNIFLSLIIGFFVPDILLFSRRFIRKKEMENDLLKAVTIMNNSFKSGRSIIQTIQIVSEELDGPLQEEFSQMVVDLNYGLTIEDVFERLEERVKLEELKYISTSLSILNKTGGNIVKVFSSIEKTFFNNRKLEEELKNLTASSKFLYYVLTFIPVFFVLIIYILDPTYFSPLFSNVIGYLILFFVVALYVTYIFIVKKVINIKEV